MLAEGRDALARVSALYLAGHESFHCFLLYCVELIKFHPSDNSWQFAVEAG